MITILEMANSSTDSDSLKDGYHHNDDYNSKDGDWWAKVFVSKFRIDATDWSSYLKFGTDKQTKMMHEEDALSQFLESQAKK